MSKKKRQRAATSTRETAGALEAFYEELLSDLWQALVSGDLLRAEQETAKVTEFLHLLDDGAHGVNSTLVDMAVRTGRPEDAALLRLMVLLGSAETKRLASEGLAELTAEGTYPPEWAADAGKAVPLRAWRRYCEFGDWERILVSFRYAAAEHVLDVLVDRTALPAVTGIDLTTGIDDWAAEVARTTGTFERHEEISLAEARWRIEEPLARSARTVRSEARRLLPVLRSRLRRLPAAEPPRAPAYTAADRAAAVTAFLSSTEGADVVAADEPATRFWAEVLTGYSSRVPWVAPAQAGAGSVAAMLASHVPEHFELTEAQRRRLRPAVTAWVRWSAAYRGLPAEAAAHLADGLADAFAGFDETYDEDLWSETRSYFADVIASDTDVAWLHEATERRLTAVPATWERDTEDEPAIAFDITTADGRRAYAETEFAACRLPADITRAEFTAGAHQVIEELWTGDPPETWERAKKLLQTHDRHDVIHELERLARSHRA